VGIGNTTAVWIKIETWVIEKIALEEGAVRGWTRAKRGVSCGVCRVMGNV
jgi:hypothetical protein